MSNKAVELALIDVKRMKRILTELHVDRAKIIQREIDKLYQKLGEDYASKKGNHEAILEEINQKLEELEATSRNPNDATDIAELTTKLSEYVIDHLTGQAEAGPVIQQILPLMTVVMAETLSLYLGEYEAAILLAGTNARGIISYCMTIGFMMHNLLKTHGLKIVSREEDVDEEAVEEMRRISEEHRDAIRRLLLDESSQEAESD